MSKAIIKEISERVRVECRAVFVASQEVSRLRRELKKAEDVEAQHRQRFQELYELRKQANEQADELCEQANRLLTSPESAADRCRKIL